MTDRVSAIERARLRMLEADDFKSDAKASQDSWNAWQQAAVDYWVLLHPHLARLRRGDPTRTPTVVEMRERAESVRGAIEDVPDSWRLAPPSPEKAEHLARVGWYHEQLAGLYGPVEEALQRLRRGDPSGTETLVRFLEADVYCDRSGYTKDAVIRHVTRANLGVATTSRLRRVVIAAVDGPDRRGFRAYVRLARRVDSDAFREDLQRLATSASRRAARHAEWVLAGLANRPG